jgi:alkylhydroperoxidase/carboxymuconolactone decarboxylase family protein YurZ
MEQASLASLRAHADRLLPADGNGSGLDSQAHALIALGVAVSVTSLDRKAIGTTIAAALDVGASVAQVEEIIALVSGLGVHSLMVSQAQLLATAQARGLLDAPAPLSPEAEALWQRHVGDDPFWDGFEQENPGFLQAMLRLSPDLFRAFFAYCAVPWKSGTVRAKIKELAAMACDAAPGHRFAPGFRLHLANAIALGATRAEVFDALDIAAAAPEHRGTD